MLFALVNLPELQYAPALCGFTELATQAPCHTEPGCSPARDAPGGEPRAALRVMLASRSRRKGGSSAWQLRKDTSLQITRKSLVCSCFYYCSPGKLSLCNQVLSSEAANTAQRDAHRAAARQGLPQPSKFILLPLQVGSSGRKLKTISAIFFP